MGNGKADLALVVVLEEPQAEREDEDDKAECCFTVTPVVLLDHR
jgi:hypothetical protein